MYKRLFTFLLAIVSLTSCTMTEEVTVNEKGEVEYLQKIDMPQFAAMMNSSDLDEKIEKNLISNTEYTYLDFMKMIEEVGGQKTKDKFSKFSIYKDELAAIDFLKLRLDLRDKFAIEVINRSSSVDEFNEKSVIIEKVFGEIKLKEEQRILTESSQKKRKKRKAKLENETPLFSDNPMGTITSARFFYDGKTFSKSIDSEKFSNDFHTNDLSTEEEKQMFFGMLKQIKFKYKYTFPKKIKSLNLADAMFTADGKSFVKEYTLEEILNAPHLGDFKVELED
ncbi:hypothetical protein [Empedobacter brevis]|uniref:hypothetical protein n=1 Tax=Empedobacter brevis TaxID=247 RepID=UPI002FE14115